MLKVMCEEHLAKVQEFARSIGLEDQLYDKLTYLKNYGFVGMREEELPSEYEQNICVLGKDFAPHSFSFAMYRKPNNTNERIFWFNGGLIYQGPDSPANGSAPSFTVSLADGVGWFIHT